MDYPCTVVVDMLLPYIGDKDDMAVRFTSACELSGNIKPAAVRDRILGYIIGSSMEILLCINEKVNANLFPEQSIFQALYLSLVFVTLDCVF